MVTRAGISRPRATASRRAARADGVGAMVEERALGFSPHERGGFDDL